MTDQEVADFFEENRTRFRPPNNTLEAIGDQIRRFLESQRQQLELQLAALSNQVEQEVEGAITEYATALSRWKATEISALAAREASRVAQESYQEGVAIQADWLNAQEREIQAEVVLVQASLANRPTARASLAALMRAP